MSLLIPLNKNKTSYLAILEDNGDFYHINIKKTPALTRFSCDSRLSFKLRKHSKVLEKCLCQCSDVAVFFNQLKLLLQANTHHKETENWDIKYYDVMLLHLQALGWEKIISINNEFNEIQLKAYDAKEREHIFSMKFSFEYPVKPPLISATLPIIFKPLWTQDSDISLVYNQFMVFIQQFERFWDEIDELLEHTWILEPECPNFSATSFRIAIDKTSSIQVKVDPLNMGVVPECIFIGAEWIVSALRDKFHCKYDEWNEHISLYQNLRRILEIDFPKQQFNDTQDVSLQCGICYAYRLGVSVPDQICSDKRCGQPFHHECLLEWLKSVSGSKQSFNIIFGECPYCTTSIKINMLRD